MTIDEKAKVEGIAISKANAYRPKHPEKTRKSRIKYGKKPGKLPPLRALKLAPPEAPVIPDFMAEILARHISTPFG